jgi:hypothetical protein
LRLVKLRVLTPCNQIVEIGCEPPRSKFRSPKSYPVAHCQSPVGRELLGYIVASKRTRPRRASHCEVIELTNRLSICTESIRRRKVRLRKILNDLNFGLAAVARNGGFSVRVRQAELPRHDNEIRQRRGLHFAHQIGAMNLHSRLTGLYFGSDLLVALTRNN